MPDNKQIAFSVADIAGALKKSKQAINKRIKEAECKPIEKRGKGGAYCFNLDQLPLSAQERKRVESYCEEKAMEKEIANLPGPVEVEQLPVTQPEALPPATAEQLPAPASLAKWQRDTMDARCVILNFIDHLAEAHGLNKAIAKVIAQAKVDLLPEHIQSLIPMSNARSGGEMGKRTLSRRTLFRWRELRSLGVTALAPKELPKRPIPAWAPYFLKVYRVPQRISVAEALDNLESILPDGMNMPSESQCRRFLKKISKVDREKGRRTGNDLRAIKPCRHRDTSDLMPLEVGMCDGHSFKAKVAHPAHGRPFHPEVCTVIDAATRVATGWSAGLAESAETVADALRHSCTVNATKTRGGVPLIFYTDPGSGNKANVNADPVFGRYARLGITFKTGIVGNSQARGMIERFNKSCWIRAAKQLPTFTGNDMDGSTLYKTTRLLDKDIKEQGRSNLLITWKQFLDLCQQAIDAYNNRPHSQLPKITDASGKRRHMTPNEMWDSFVAKGWQPDTLTNQELDDLFRPRVQVGTRKGEVRLFGNIYFHTELQHHHGEQVFLEYEPQDGRFVYVRDMDERLICKAEFEANKSAIFPVSAREKAAEDRAVRRSKLAENKLIEIEEERRGVVDIPSLDATKIAAAKQKLLDSETAEKQPENVVTLPNDPAGRMRLYKNLRNRLAQGEEINQWEVEWLERFEKSTECRVLKELETDCALAEEN